MVFNVLPLHFLTYHFVLKINIVQVASKDSAGEYLTATVRGGM